LLGPIIFHLVILLKSWYTFEKPVSENPESMMDKIPVTPNMLHAQRTSTPNSVINGISTRTQKLIQKKEREGVHSALIQNRGKLFQPTVTVEPWS